MRKLFAFLLLLALTVPPIFASGRGRSYGTSRSASRSSSRSSSSHRSYGARSRRSSTIKCYGCARDNRGHIKRSQRAVHSFRSAHPCPATGRTRGACPGYQVDHRVPLYQGGSDAPSNMQWLSTEQHKAKHREMK